MAAAPDRASREPQAVTQTQLATIDRLVSELVLKISGPSLKVQLLQEMTAVRLQEVTLASQAATIVNYLTMQLSRSKYHYDTVATAMRQCWIPYCTAQAEAVGTPVDWRVTPGRVTEAIAALLDDEDLTTLSSTRTNHAKGGLAGTL